MSQLNANYIIDTSVLLALLTFAVRIMYVRLNKTAYLKGHKYKSGMTEYNNVQKMTSYPVLVVTSLLLMSVATRVGFDVYHILTSKESYKYGFLFFGTLGVVLFYCLIVLVAFYTLGIPIRKLRRYSGKGKGQWPV